MDGDGNGRWRLTMMTMMNKTMDNDDDGVLIE
jgi:hypothetical protein